MSRRAWIALVLAVSLTGCSDPPPPPAAAPEREDPSGGQDPDGPGASAQQDPEPQPAREPEPSPEPKPEPLAPNRSPEARVTPTTLQAKVGEPVELDASNSSDPDGEVVSYTW
ncbi:MAG: hypothetical protein KDD82_18630, partial [Planctomycetes bacterium]|nr:hypothetical protein [Planctomycetota bacterium]